MKKAREFKRIVATSLLVCTVTSLTGCGTISDDLMKYNKTELVVQYRQLESNYESTLSEYQQYRQSVVGTYNEDIESAGIVQTGDGSGRYTFTTKDSSIVFPEEFVYPGSSNVSSTGSVNITDKVSISATDNWITNINSNTLTLEHTNGISGTIKVGTVNLEYNVEKLKDDILSKWSSILPPATVKYSYIYLLGVNTKVGVQLATPTYIDSSDACLRCGMIAYSNTTVSYVFTYKGTQDNTKDEAIKSVLDSMHVSNNIIKVE